MMYAKGGQTPGVNLDSKNPVRKNRENLKNIEDIEIKKKGIVTKDDNKEEVVDEIGDLKPVTKYHK